MLEEVLREILKIPKVLKIFKVLEYQENYM